MFPLLSTILNADLKKGDTGKDVEWLQKLLALNPNFYPEGLVTGTFGPKTVKAVTNFQMEYGVIQTPFDVGAGRCGPKTRKRIKEIFGVTVTLTSTVTTTVDTPAQKWVAPIRNDKFKLTQTFLNPSPLYKITGHHPGVDYGTQGDTNVPLYFVTDGEVVESGLHRDFGNYFFFYIAPVDKTLAYFHLRDGAPLKGKYKGGVQCGVAGETGLAEGVHLHLECMKGRKTSADRRTLYTSFTALKLAAEDADTLIRTHWKIT